MRINSINSYFPTNLINSGKNIARLPFCGNSGKNISFSGELKDWFEKTHPVVNQNHKPTPFGVPDKVLGTDFETLKNYVPNLNKEVMVAALDTYNVAKMTKNMFDKEYGKDNYVLVSIGRSPSGIAKALEIMGGDVRYMPISDVRAADERQIARYSDINRHPEYLEYLDLIDVKKDKINNSNKHYLFVDYTHRGKTLNAIEDVADNNGINPKKAHFISLNDRLKQEFYENPEQYKQINDYFNYYCGHSFIEEYTDTPYMPFDNTMSVISRVLSPYKTKKAKDFEYALCYLYKKDQLSGALCEEAKRKGEISFKGVPFGIDDGFGQTQNSILNEKTKDISPEVKKMASITYKTAKITEDMLNKKYGQNWAFISVGTSPAGVGKALELMGCDVLYTPISKVNHVYMDNMYAKFINSENHPDYMNFLRSIGLNKDKINNGEKQYIVADYTFSGKTLKTLKDFAYKSGVDPKKLYFISLNETLRDYTDRKQWSEIKSYFNDFCRFHKMGKYAGIPHIPYNKTSLIGHYSKNFEKNQDAKDFEYALLECIRKDK